MTDILDPPFDSTTDLHSVGCLERERPLNGCEAGIGELKQPRVTRNVITPKMRSLHLWFSNLPELHVPKLQEKLVIKSCAKQPAYQSVMKHDYHQSKEPERRKMNKELFLFGIHNFLMYMHFFL